MGADIVPFEGCAHFIVLPATFTHTQRSDMTKDLDGRVFRAESSRVGGYSVDVLREGSEVPLAVAAVVVAATRLQVIMHREVHDVTGGIFLAWETGQRRPYELPRGPGGPQRRCMSRCFEGAPG
jgi:hypothetical protein